jgi:hypothetical protein
LKLPPSFFDTDTLEDTIAPFIERWQKQSSLKIWVDLPANLPSTLEMQDIFGVDPFWHKPQSNRYWRVHGWHDTRWVRRYSDETLKTLAKNCVRHKPEVVVFAHSQRFAQSLEFLAHLGRPQ